ncbi:hypothetical protein ALQ08_103128 [Pseudomonas syringae pv. delphinii]|uniref:Uncharacterized protein n=2 Tax=Pseudomonas syringae group genomosp. 3 TaxID=251701 RepID=A0A3M4KJ24_9PSED|nr:hypothetical protein ALO40_101983 [Pseudomonas syringae pv. viburni]RMP20080.1 hypothetical protein ALQ27_103205 [Pseudomonas syringae pv. delphinii]RMQ29262.1 hypothetical protein ALQ08_103128 [Pseudomonas syringae pv. delphinii]
MYNAERTARAQAGLITDVFRQGGEQRRVDVFRKTPAGLIGSARVGQAALVAEAAHRAQAGVGHGGCHAGIRHRAG